MCQMQYFISYLLGWSGYSGKAADKGTIVHKALELLAKIKKAHQEGKRQIKDTEIGGPVTKKMLVKDYLKTDENIKALVDEIYTHFASASEKNTHLKWSNADNKDCYNWTMLALKTLDPRKMNIIDVEPYFDIKINDDLFIKGTIDLVVRVAPGIYEVIDWKTGARMWDWAKDEAKLSFQHDPQLMLYHYSVTNMYEEARQVLCTIYYMRVGPPETVAFGPEDLKEIESLLTRRQKEIQGCDMPCQNRSWKCRSFCDAGKTTFEGTSITPIKEFRQGKWPCKGSEYMTKCEQVKYCLDNRGMPAVVENMTKIGHSVGFYKDPGKIG